MKTLLFAFIITLMIGCQSGGDNSKEEVTLVCLDGLEYEVEGDQHSPHLDAHGNQYLCE